MKLVKLSLATILGLGAVSGLSASTLADALSSGKVSGKATVWYQTNDKADLFDQASSIGDAGLQLGYVTSDYNGLGFGVTGYALDSLNLHYDVVSGTPHGPLGVNETSSWLGEAYFTYKIDNTLVKVGRQNLDTPFAKSDGWAVHPNNFEAVVVINSDLPNTTLIGAFVNKERTRTSSTFADFYTDDGAWMVAAIYSGIKDTPIKLFAYDVVDVAQAVYTDVSTKVGDITIAGQYMLMMPDASAADDTNAFGLKASTKISGISLTGAVSMVDDGTLRVANTGDGMTKTPIYTATITGDGDVSSATDTIGYKLSAGMSVAKDLSTTLSWGFYDHGEDSSATPVGVSDDSMAVELVAKYKGLQNLTIFGGYFYTDEATGAYSNAGDDLNTVRVWGRYSF